MRTNLIIHHGVADVPNQAAKLIRVLGAIQEPCDLASLFQWSEVLKDIIKFPSKFVHVSWVLASETMDYRLRIILLSSSFIPPSGTGPLSDSASCSTRGINDSIVWRHATVF